MKKPKSFSIFASLSRTKKHYLRRFTNGGVNPYPIICAEFVTTFLLPGQLPHSKLLFNFTVAPEGKFKILGHVSAPPAHAADDRSPNAPGWWRLASDDHHQWEVNYWDEHDMYPALIRVMEDFGWVDGTRFDVVAVVEAE
jgi:hypothetical protein